MFLLKQQNFSTQKNLTLAGKQIIALLQENEALDIELAYLTSPPRLRHILSSLQQNGYSPNLSILGLGDLKTLEDLTSFYNWRQLSLQKPPATTW
jgi:hypothetical protein